MAINDNGTRNQYTATAAQTIFPYTFEVFSKDDIAVEQNGALLTEGTHYTVSGVGVDAGGNVTLVTGATSGDIMTLYRNMNLERLTDYQQNGDFLAAEVNDDFDRLWAAQQQINGTAELSIRAPIDDTALNSSNTELADIATRSGKVLGFDSTGRLEYVNAAIGAGNIDLNSYQINNLGKPTDLTDAVRLGDVLGITEDGLITIPSVSESKTLTDGQTVVTFTEYTTTLAEFHINGVGVDSRRLNSNDMDVPAATETSITLLESYPAGTIVTLTKRTGTGEGIDSGIRREFVHNFTTLADAIASTKILAGDSVNLKERTTGNGGGAMWDIVLASSVTANTYNIVACTGVASLALVLRVGTVANVKQFGAVGDGVVDDTAAIQAALDYSASACVNVPKGTYKITAALTMLTSDSTLVGDNMRGTIIQQTTPNTPVLQVGGSFNKVESLSLNFSPSLPYTDSSAVCLNLVDVNFNSSFRDLRLTNGAYAIKLTTKDTANANCFSCSFDNIYAFGVSHTGMDLTSVNGGSTGNVFTNMYINFKRAGVAQNAVRGVKLSAVNESVFNQLNIEHGKIAQAILANGGETLTINSLHLEGLEPMDGVDGVVATSTGFISGTQDTIIVNSLSIINCTFDDTYLATYAVIHSTSGMRSEVHGLVTRTNTKTGTPNFRIYSNDSDANNGLCWVYNQEDDSGELNTNLNSQNLHIDGFENSTFVNANEISLLSGTPTLATCGGARQVCWTLSDAATDTLSGKVPELCKNWLKFNVYGYFTQNSLAAGVARISLTYDTYDDTDALNVSGTTTNLDHTVGNVKHQLDTPKITATSLTMDGKDFQSFRISRAGSHANDTLAADYELIGLRFERAQ